MTGFVSQVDHIDGKVWVPNRDSLDNPVPLWCSHLRREQRLTDIYRRKGIDALIDELKKSNRSLAASRTLTSQPSSRP